MQLRVELLGNPRVLRDGEAVKLRTNHQLLLLSRFLIHHPEPIDRGETAALLWPEASETNRATYLRRAVMELRQIGFDVQADGRGLLLNHQDVTCDLLEEGDDAPQSVDEVLKGISHAIASEVRSNWKVRVQARLDYASESRLRPSEKLRLWLVERLIEERPEDVIKALAAHGHNMVYNKPTQGLLDLYQEVLRNFQTAVPDRVRLLLYAAEAADAHTHFSLAEKFLDEAIIQAKQLEMSAEEAKAYGILANIHAEKHNFEQARVLAEKSVAKALESGNLRPASGSLINLGHIYGQHLRLESSVACFLKSLKIAEEIEFEGQVKVAIASLAYYWGILGCDVDTKVFSRIKKEPGLGYMSFIDAYTHFCLSVGYGDAENAAEEAEAELRITSEQGRERLFYVAIDHCAIALSLMGRQQSAALLVRAGTEFRRNFGTGRSRLERRVIKRHVPSPFFGADLQDKLNRLSLHEPRLLAEEISTLMK